MSTSLRRLLPTLVVAALAVSLAPSPATAVQQPSAPEARALALINDARQGMGRVPLRWDDRLADIAQDRSDYMARTGNFTHPANLAELVGAEGIVWHRLGETLVKDKSATALASADVAVRTWRNSSAHWDILSNSEYNYIAIGLARASDGWFYWTGLLIKGPDRTPPVAKPSGARVGSVISGKRSVTVSWTGQDVRLSVLTAGLRDFRLQRKVGSNSWVTVTDWTTATSRQFSLTVGKTYRFRVKGRDWAGNRSTWSAALTVTA